MQGRRAKPRAGESTPEREETLLMPTHFNSTFHRSSFTPPSTISRPASGRRDSYSDVNKADDVITHRSRLQARAGVADMSAAPVIRLYYGISWNSNA